MITDELIELIKRQISYTMQDDLEYYDGYKVYVSSELQYNKIKNKEKKAIYMVVRFLPASLNFGQKLLPISINAISEKNTVKVCQKLLMDFAEKYNLTVNEDSTIQQVYTSPSVTSNFNEIFDGFRSVLTMSGTYLVTENANPYHLEYFNSEGKYEEIPAITLSVSFDNSLDMQPFFNSSNFTKSKAKFATLTLNFSIYLTNNELSNKTLKIAYKQLPIDTRFRFKIGHLQKTEENDKSIEFEEDFRLVNMTTQKNIGELQMCVMTFTI